MSTLAPAPAGPAEDSSGKIRVMVVDDSAVVRGLVSRWIDEDPDMEAVGRFANGQYALDGILGCAPDVVVLDIEMPVMDGITALPELLRLKPDAKVLVASTLSRRNAVISLKALELGATDYIPKPEGNSGVTTSLEFRRELVNKVRALGPRRPGHAPLRALPEPRPANIPVLPGAAETITLRPFSAVKPKVVVVGSSTGGPQALARLLGDMAPATAGLPVLAAQHMPRMFTTVLAELLGHAAGRAVREAEDGEAVVPGGIYLAPGGLHMTLAEKAGAPVLRVADGPPVNFCKPAVDPLFESVSAFYGSETLALVLTGMGHDGAAGAVRIADAGGSVIAQDRETSVVWGMPRAAAASGACAAVLPLDEIGPKVGALVRGGAS